MSKKWNLIVDVERCDNCRNCFLATKDEHIGNDFPGYAAPQPEKQHSWVDIKQKERGHYPIVEANFMPVMCNHCDDAPCMKVAKDGAITKRADGIVIIDPEKSKGQKEIVDACPYGAVYWNEEKQIPQAWIFDAHLLDSGWTKPRVEQSCPTDVFRSLKIDDREMQRLKEEEDLVVLQPELESKPRVYYKNLHLMNTCFVSGSVTADVNGIEECAEGASVTLKQNDVEVGRAKTDVFGEFKIDKLAPQSGAYELTVSSVSWGAYATDVKVEDDSLYLGVIKLG
ncbi:MAG: oxidoreductase [Rhodospirillaceae bacterium]|jgi:Fe-S-cluster-containing dehydrogenase component|nr:oxidoreductase [Rhodospirillaceae bacterium]